MRPYQEAIGAEIAMKRMRRVAVKALVASMVAAWAAWLALGPKQSYWLVFPASMLVGWTTLGLYLRRGRLLDTLASTTLWKIVALVLLYGFVLGLRTSLWGNLWIRCAVACLGTGVLVLVVWIGLRDLKRLDEQTRDEAIRGART